MTRTRMREVAVPQVDSDVRRSRFVGLEKDQIPGFDSAHGAAARVVLRVGRSGEMNSQHRIDVLNVAGAVKSVSAGSAENIGGSEEAQGASRQVVGDPGAAVKQPARKL